MSDYISDAIKLAIWTASLAKIDAGGGAQLHYYTDTYAGSAQTPNPAALLGTVALPVPAGVATVSGVELYSSSAQAQAIGVPAWARLENALGELITDGSCAAGGVFELVLESGTVMYPGGDILFQGGLIGFE
jgi:hypothetical protein